MTAVSFRDLVGSLPADESSHSLYPYPARLVRHIPRFFLESGAIGRDATVVDPFCGSGTVLLEAALGGRQAYGIDSNPVAALIAEVKTTPLNAEKPEIEALARACVERAAAGRRKYEPSLFVEKWYSRAAYSMLCRLAAVVEVMCQNVDRPQANLLRLALARTALDHSIRDPRIPVPVRLAESPNTNATSDDVRRGFLRVTSRLATLACRIPNDLPTVEVRLGDARTAASWPCPETPSVMVTSPPYGAAQKYVRSTSLEAAWLGYADARGTRTLERSSIGREHLDESERARSADLLKDDELRENVEDISEVDPYRAAIYLNYFVDMQAALRVGLQTSRPETVILVCGTNRVVGMEIETHRHLARMVSAQGYKLRLKVRDEIRGRTLLTVRHRGSQPAHAEVIYMFDKVCAPASIRSGA